MNNIIFIGFKNCGKTSVGKTLANKLHKKFVDTDHLIEQEYFKITQTQQKTCEIYQLEGECYFRDLESNIVANLTQLQDAIISTGGGCVLRENNITNFKKCGKLIYLETSIAELKKRGEDKVMPAFLDDTDPDKSWMAMYEQREPLYARYADFRVFTDGKTVDELVLEILNYPLLR